MFLFRFGNYLKQIWQRCGNVPSANLKKNLKKKAENLKKNLSLEWFLGVLESKTHDFCR